MVRKEWIKEILETLIESSGKVAGYSRKDIERSILECRGADPRTIKTWFDALFRLDYIVQYEYGYFSLNLSRAAELEVKLPPQVDPKQRRLGLS